MKTTLTVAGLLVALTLTGCSTTAPVIEETTTPTPIETTAPIEVETETPEADSDYLNGGDVFALGENERSISFEGETLTCEDENGQKAFEITIRAVDNNKGWDFNCAFPVTDEIADAINEAENG